MTPNKQIVKTIKTDTTSSEMIGLSFKFWGILSRGKFGLLATYSKNAKIPVIKILRRKRDFLEPKPSGFPAKS